MKYFLLAAALALTTHIASGQGSSRKPAAAAQSAEIKGKVIETTNAAGYTYIRVESGKQKVWAAAPQFAVKKGDTVAFSSDMPMRDYHSKTLNRTFDMVYFTGGVTVNGARPSAALSDLPPNHPPISGASAAKPAVDLSGIKKPENGKTVEEILSGKSTLRGQTVTVRGKVVKYNAMILGKNWLHVQDGTGGPGSNDLVVTTSTPAKVGDTVLVTGVVTTDKDFGSGYKYALIIEDAKVKVE